MLTNSSRRPRQGFTLIEVLLGLMIFGIISVTLYNTFWLGLKIDRKSNEINTTYQEARLAFELMSKDLENTFRYDFSASYPKQTSFDGSATEMSFLVPSDEGVRQVRYYLTIPEVSSVTRIIMKQRFKTMKSSNLSMGNLPIAFLMRQEIPLIEFLAKKKTSSPGEIIAVAIKKGSFNLEYGALKRDAQGIIVQPKKMEWSKSWKKNSIPHAVRVSLTLFDQESPKQGVVLKRDIYLPEIDWDHE